MTTGVEETLAARWAWWHAEREEKLRAPHGWLSLTGLHWLAEQPGEFPGVPGQWRVEGGKARVSASASAGLIVDGRVLDGTAEVLVPDDGAVTFAEFGGTEFGKVELGKTESGETGIPAGRDDRAAIEVIVRSGRYGIRIRDPKAPLRLAFTGVPAFPVSGQWVLTARLDRYPTACEMVVDTAQNGLTGTELAIGELRFRAAGLAQSLIAFADGDDGITVVFSDVTSGVSTAPWRALWVALTDEDSLQLDFNRAVNFPSAFSDYGTCPKPPAGNVLNIPVEAGERKPV
ncbi:MAG TPA: DUF1684 domain-containing protein [Pseudonocardiaceae bacterium]|jgi:hypothetical protein|nr:DUF1684 domain-containing protein [Pseudonocardiaceae bacterium]